MSLNTNIDFSTYLALGDSITSGYADGALYREGQLTSFASLLTSLFKNSGGGDFRQALVPVGSPGIGSSGNGRLILRSASPGAEPVPEYSSIPGDLTIFNEDLYDTQGPFNNIGVPGAKVSTALFPGLGDPSAGSGNFNPFFTRMAKQPATSSMLSDALALHPTFFTLFIGNNDALAFALSGATADPITPLKGAAGIGFEESYRAIVDALVAAGAKGAVANLPDIRTLPFFTAISYDGLVPDHLSLPKLKTIYDAQGILLHEGHNAFVMQDPSEPRGLRQVKKGELILFDVMLDPGKKNYLDGSVPLPKKYVLSLREAEQVHAAILSYNDVIGSIAKEKDLGFVDVNAVLRTSAADRTYHEDRRQMSFSKKGIFSLDGIHINRLGHALLANEFIKAINATYHTQLPLLNSARYRDIRFP